MGLYYGNTILRARAQYRVEAADGQEPAAAGDWQQAEFTAAELTEHTDDAAAPLTLSAVERDADLLRQVLRAALRHRSGAGAEVRQIMVEVMCTSTLDEPWSTAPHWLPVPDSQERYP